MVKQNKKSSKIKYQLLSILKNYWFNSSANCLTDNPYLIEEVSVDISVGKCFEVFVEVFVVDV